MHKAVATPVSGKPLLVSRALPTTTAITINIYKMKELQCKYNSSDILHHVEQMINSAYCI